MIEKIGPYRVYERLGVGGMGEVYKAYDDRLDRWVAIKRIRPDREDAEDNRERFKREARATARLNHPSIVHLYGIFQEGDSDCIVMEYVDGQTLDQVLVSGPLDPLRVANLGHEIAAGLAEAHANGILHRDLKAENIMITPRGRAKILDFGLAKPILNAELDPVLTGKGQLVGTSRAMSPEYVSGEKVDHRSDLFSLGVLLYECLTGTSPFKAHNTLATLKQVMLHKQTPIRQLNSKVPPELAELIELLLEKDPKNRPQSAHEIALAFGRLTGQVSSGVVDIPGGVPTGDPNRNSSTLTSFSASDTVLDLRPRHRWMTLLVVVGVLVAGAFVLGKFFTGPSFDEPNLPPEERVHVVLADFENHTDEKTLGASLRRGIRAMLEQSRSSSVLSQGQMSDALRRMQKPQDSVITRDLARDICKREGAAWFIIGSVSKFGNSYSVVLEVVDPETDEALFSFTDTSTDSQELLSDLESGGLKIRAYLGDSVAEIQTSIPLAKVTTPYLEALKAYTLGLERVEDYRRPEEAVPFFERALELDPDFSMAHAKLGVAFSNLQDRDRGLKHFNAAMAKSERLSEVELYYVKAWLARWNGTPDDVVENWATMSELHPQSYAAAFNLGQALWYYRNDFASAAKALEKGVEVSRGAVRDSGLNLLGQMYLALGKIEKAEVMLENIQLEEQSEPLKTYLFLTSGRQDQVAVSAESFPSLTPGQRLLVLSLVAAAQDDFEESLRLLEEAERLGREEVGIRFHALADRIAVLRELDREAELEQAMQLALDEGRKHLRPPTMEFENSTVSLFAIIGKIYARQGEVQEAQEILAELQDVVSEAQKVKIWRLYEAILEAEVASVSDSPESVGVDLVALARETPSFQAVETMDKLGLGNGDGGSRLGKQRGLAIMECSKSCYGRMYSLLLSLETPLGPPPVAVLPDENEKEASLAE